MAVSDAACTSELPVVLRCPNMTQLLDGVGQEHSLAMDKRIQGMTWSNLMMMMKLARTPAFYIPTTEAMPMGLTYEIL